MSNFRRTYFRDATYIRADSFSSLELCLLDIYIPVTVLALLVNIVLQSQLSLVMFMRAINLCG